MSARLGLGIGRDEVRAVLVRGGAIAWHARAAIDAETSLPDALAAVLQSVPRPRWYEARWRTVAAVGPSAAQLRRLTGLPPAKSARLLAQAVERHARRFFLRHGVPLRITHARPVGDGTMWMGAIEAPVMQALETACRHATVRLQGATPTAAVLVAALALDATRAHDVVWIDSDAMVELHVDAGVVAGVRRSVRHDVDASCPPLPVAVALADACDLHGGDAWQLADAYAAAVVRDEMPLVHPAADAARAQRIAGVRRAVLVGMVIATVAAALFVPGMLAQRAAEQASVQLAALQREASTVRGTQAELDRLTHALQQASDFAKSRPRLTHLLARLTEALPESTALLTLHVDSVGGHLVALTPKGAVVLPALKRVPTIATAQITGAITHELVGAANLERAAVRFQFPAASRRAQRLPNVRGMR